MKIIPGLENCSIAPFGDSFAHKIIVAYISFHKILVDYSDFDDTVVHQMSPISGLCRDKNDNILKTILCTLEIGIIS